MINFKKTNKMENKAKEKAIELVEKFGDKASDVCDEILDVLCYDDSDYGTRMFNFFKSVKEEIKNLK